MIREIFLGPLYILRVASLGPQHAIRISCMCGAGPWYLNPFWLRDRYPPSEFLRAIVEGLKCPRCHARDMMAWTMVEAADGEAFVAHASGRSEDPC